MHSQLRSEARSLLARKAAGKKHFIGPTELLAVVTARVLWARFLDGARTFVFIDHRTGLAS